MLGNKEKGGFSSSNNTTLISSDAEVIGDIKFSGNLDIEGIVKGNIIAQSGKEAVVRVAVSILGDNGALVTRTVEANVN